MGNLLTQKQLLNKLRHDLDAISIAERRLVDVMMAFIDQGGRPEELCTALGMSKATLYRRIKDAGVVR